VSLFFCPQSYGQSVTNGFFSSSLGF
jgi:hypothetical protein